MTNMGESGVPNGVWGFSLKIAENWDVMDLKILNIGNFCGRLANFWETTLKGSGPLYGRI